MDGSSTALLFSTCSHYWQSHLEERVTPEEPWLHPGNPPSLQGKASLRRASDQQESLVFKNPKLSIFVFYDLWCVWPFNIVLLTQSCHFSCLQFISPGTSRTFINREFSLWWTALKPFFKEKSIGMCGSTSGYFILPHRSICLLLGRLTPYEDQSFRATPEPDTPALSFVLVQYWSRASGPLALPSKLESACQTLKLESADLRVTAALVPQPHLR